MTAAKFNRRFFTQCSIGFFFVILLTSCDSSGATTEHRLLEKGQRQVIKTLPSSSFSDPLFEGEIARLGTTQYHLGTSLSSPVLSLDGTMFAVIDHLHNVRTMDLKGVRHLEMRFKQQINEIALSPDGALLAISQGHYENANVLVYKVDSGKLLHRFQTKGAKRIPLAFSANGQLLFSSAPKPHAARAWDMQTGQVILEFEALNDDGSNHFWVAEKITISPNGKLVTASGLPSFRGYTWNINSTVLLSSWDRESPNPNMVLKKTFTPDSAGILISRRDAPFLQYQEFSKKEVRTFLKIKDQVKSISFSPSGKFIALTLEEEHSVYLWSWPEFELVQEIPIPNYGLKIIGFSADGSIAVISWGRPLELWDIETARLKNVLPGHKSPLVDAQFSRDGESLVSLSSSGEVIEWSFRDFKPQKVHSLPIKYTGQQLITYKDEISVLIRSSENSLIQSLSGKTLRILDPHGWRMSTSGDLLISHDSRNIQWWSYLEKLKLHHEKINATEGLIQDARVSTDGAWIAVVSGKSHVEVSLWSAKSGERRSTLKIDDNSSMPTEVLWLPNQSSFVVATHSGSFLFNVDESGVLSEPHLLNPGNEKISKPSHALAVSSDGHWLAVSVGNKVALWNLRSLTFKRFYEGHDGIVRCLAFSPDNTRLVSGGDDRSLVLWKLPI